MRSKPRRSGTHKFDSGCSRAAGPDRSVTPRLPDVLFDRLLRRRAPRWVTAEGCGMDHRRVVDHPPAASSPRPRRDVWRSMVHFGKIGRVVTRPASRTRLTTPLIRPDLRSGRADAYDAARARSSTPRWPRCSGGALRRPGEWVSALPSGPPARSRRALIPRGACPRPSTRAAVEHQRSAQPP